MTSNRWLSFLLALVTIAPVALRADGLSAEEQRIVAYVDANSAGFAAELERAVNIDSPSENLAGVRQMGAVFGADLAALGFNSRFVELPAATGRAGHLVADRVGTKGQRLLLIGHLDTVLPGGNWRRDGDTAHGSGANDMKGGDLIIIHALRALHGIGALEGTSITVIMTGDEESTGDPLSVSRRDLVEAAQRSDLALGFETAIGKTGTIARRGIISWGLDVQGATGHSSGIFSAAVGSGSVYEAARILNGFHDELSKIEGVTLNPAMIVGGTQAALAENTGTASGKTNIIAQHTIAKGDLRYLSAEQMAQAQAIMQAIVAKHRPRTSAVLTFADDAFPAMAPTPANYALLAQLDQASRDLGFGPVTAFDPKARGAGDISFISPPLPGLDGLGIRGTGAHAPTETADLATVPELVKRAALLIYRLTR